MSEKKWWARLNHRDGYGDWVPTGCTEREDAADHIKLVHSGRNVREWLLM